MMLRINLYQTCYRRLGNPELENIISMSTLQGRVDFSFWDEGIFLLIIKHFFLSGFRDGNSSKWVDSSPDF